ncbi:MAG: ParB/RepB/Spo0J family partition protein [Terriglobia bacterium]|jgi:ParB family chromosome partitioning protein
MTRKALGRGLNALLRTVETTTAGLEEVALDQIDPNPFQPRRAFPSDKLQELANSIRSSGVVQPVLLRRSNQRYQLIAGERRWRAARLAGLAAIPALVRELGDRDALELALTENLLREDLNPIEAAHGYEVLQQKHGLSHEEIAARLGLDRSTVTNTLRLLRLPPEVQELISEGKISAGHARAVLGLPESVQGEVALAIVKHGWSVREVENRVAAAGREPAQKPDASPPPPLDANLRAAVLELERTLGTRVKIRGDEKRGKIEISYYSVEDLNRIYEFIVKR